MRSEIVPGGVFPDYELPDHASVHRRLSELQGDDPLILTLLEEGVSSSLRRSRGFDVPDFLAAGPRDVLVAASEARVAPAAAAGGRGTLVPDSVAPSPLRVLAAVVIAVALVAIIVWLGIEYPG